MKKKFTAEENIIRCKTNIKAATSLYTLAGALFAVYTVRYFITGNFNFYFKFAFADLFLKLGDKGEIPLALGIALALVSLLIYILPGAFLMKKHSLFPIAVLIYIADTACLLFCDFVLWGKPEGSDFIIDIAAHLWVLLYLVVGLRSARKLKEGQRPRAEGRHAPDEALQ